MSNATLHTNHGAIAVELFDDDAPKTVENFRKLAGEGFSQISEVKKVPVTRYRWTAKGVQNGKPVEIMIDELGHVAAK